MNEGKYIHGICRIVNYMYVNTSILFFSGQVSAAGSLAISMIDEWWSVTRRD